MGHLHLEKTLNVLFYLFYTGIVKFKNFAGIIINKMIMLGICSRFFKLSIICAKLMLCHQSAIEQEFDRIIKRSSAYPVLVIFHPDIETLNIKMSLCCKNFLDNGKPFGGFSVAMFFKVFRKEFPDIVKGFFRRFLCHV